MTLDVNKQNLVQEWHYKYHLMFVVLGHLLLHTKNKHVIIKVPVILYKFKTDGVILY